MDRIERDLTNLKHVHPDLLVGEHNSFFIVESFRLPRGIYNRGETRLLVDVAPTYPSAKRLTISMSLPVSRIADRSAIKNYSEPVQLYGESWGQFSFHVINGGWDPAVDNFLTFLTAVRGRLQEGA